MIGNKLYLISILILILTIGVVSADTLDIRVSSNNDDMEEDVSTGSMDSGSSDLELTEAPETQIVGMRFQNINIPANSVVSNAYVQFQTDESYSVPTSLLIRGEATDNAQVFSSTSFDISSRSLTNSSTSWNPLAWDTVGEQGLDQRTPNIASVIQEIINRPGWNSGNSLAIMITGSGRRTAESHNGVSSAAPLLHVEWLTAPDNTTPSIPQNLLGVAVSDVQVDLSWDASSDPESGVSYYNVYRGNVLVGQPSSNSFSDTELFAETNYSYEVSAVNGGGLESDRSDLISVMTLPYVAPPPYFETRTASGNDDAEERMSNNGMYLTSSDLELVMDRSKDQEVGMRFNNVLVPKDSIITSASIVFSVDETSSGQTDLVFYGEATDNALTFSNSAGDLTSRQKTFSSVAWNNVPAWTTEHSDQETPDLSPVIQEVVNRSGWNEGNSIVIIIDGTGSRIAESYNGGSSYAPLLKIEWTPAFVDDTPPSVPQNLVGVAVSDVQVDMSWDASSDPESGVSFYNVYRDGVVVGQPSLSSFSDLGLIGDTNYSYEVSAVNGAGLESSRSNLALVTTPPPVNQPPSVGAGNDFSVDLLSSPFLDGTVSDDGLPNGTLITTWSKVSGPGIVTFGNPNTEDTNVTFSELGIYGLMLTANDGEYSVSDNVTVTVFNASASISFAIIGDYGDGSSNEAQVASMVAGWNPDFIITNGDNNYNYGEASTIDDRIGQFYSNFIYPYVGGYGSTATTNMFFPSLGNHDNNAGAGYTPYLDYFTLPGNERYYEFVRGPVHFFAVNSDGGEPDGNKNPSVQSAWLQNALAQSTSQFNVVYFHHAPYSSDAPVTSMRWPFEDWGADVVLSGHKHTYERLEFDDNGDGEYLTYIVNGLGGKSIYSFGTPIPGSIVRFNADYGAQIATATDTALTMKFYAMNGTLIDSFTISKIPNQPPVVSASYYYPIVVALDGTVTDDGSFSTLWSFVSGPGTVVFDDATVVDTEARFSVAGNYTLRLTADDGSLQTSYDVVVPVVDPLMCLP